MLAFIFPLAAVNAYLSPEFGCWLEFDTAIHQGKDGVITSQTHVLARPNPGAALTNNNRTCPDDLTIITLDPEPLRLAISP
jgi:hypothetical protein